MTQLIQILSPLSVLDYLFFKAIPFVFLWRIKEIKFKKLEIILLLLSVIGAFLFDIRALIYTSFIYCIAYIRNKIYLKQKYSIVIILIYQILFWVMEINKL